MKMNNVAYFLEYNALTKPDKIAFHYVRSSEYQKITYKGLNEQSAKLANGLSGLGILKGDRVMVCLTISPELYLSIAALQRIGAIPVLLESMRSAQDISLIFANAKPKGIISSGKIIHSLSNLLQVNDVKLRISIDNCDGFIHLDDVYEKKGSEIMPLDQWDTALITYTTGSSGQPKGANRTHHFLAAQHYALKRLFPYRDNDIDLPVFPVFTLNNIASGITTVLPAIDISNPDPRDSELLVSQISEFGVNCMTLAPSSFRNLANYCIEKNIRLSGLERVLTGGAPISEKEIALFVSISPNSKNYILYGSTEVEPISYIESREVIDQKADVAGKVSNLGVNVGKIDKELRHRLMPIDAIGISGGGIGELVVAGEHVCSDYFQNEEAFLSTKNKDEDGCVWHRTGDLGYLDDKGYLWIVGRVHNVIMKRGKCYFPVRPEIMVKSLPGVLNAAYLSVGLQDRDDAVMAVTAEHDNKKFLEKAIFDVLTKADFPVDRIIFMDSIPMDIRHHSKVEYNLLRQKIHEVYK